MSHATFEEVISKLEQLYRERVWVIVAIDGRGGAGKSSLARALVAKFPNSSHIEHDWFHLPKNEVVEGRRFDHERLVADVIAPFRVGTQKLTFYRYNWGYLTGEPDGFHETPLTIAHKEILIIEGCETLHSALYPHLDLRIWLDTSPKVALERGMRRDVEEYKLDPERVRAAWAEWSSWEEKSLAHDDRRMRADFILNFSKD